MTFRFIKISAILISFIFLTGFVPFITLLGPGFTVATTGSVSKAGVQYIVNKSIKDSTGKNSFDFFKEKIKNDRHNKQSVNQELQKLVEKRIKLTRKKLTLQNINQ